jgi:electron transfer flavoprotein alpha/beta subunit
MAGMQADDDNHTQVGGLVARLLDWPSASSAMSMSLQNSDTVRV